MIGQDKREALKRRMVSLGTGEDELIERFIRGTGHGGQKINKTSSCVYLITHRAVLKSNARPSAHAT